MLVNIIIDENILNFTISKRDSLCRQSVQVLFFILECHGPRLFDHLWKSFKESEPTQPSRNKSNNDEDNLQEECSLQQYDDFFGFVKSVLQHIDTAEGQDKQKQVGCVIVFVCDLPEMMLICIPVPILSICPFWYLKLHSMDYYSIF
jgi:hypothetical protein